MYDKCMYYFMIINSLSPAHSDFPSSTAIISCYIHNTQLSLSPTHSVIVPEVRVQEQSPLFHLPPQSLQDLLHLTLLIISTETVWSLCARGEEREGGLSSKGVQWLCVEFQYGSLLCGFLDESERIDLSYTVSESM